MIKENPKRRLSIHCRETKWYWGQHSVNPHFLEIFLYGEHQHYYTFYLMQKFGLSIQNAQLLCLPSCLPLRQVR